MNEHQEEKLPFTIFTYKWELTAVSKSRKTILSRMIQFRGENVFRAGLQNHEYEYRGRFSSLLFLTSDLAKLGLKVDTVLYSVSSKHHGNSEIEKMNVRIGKPDDKVGKVQLFTASASCGDSIVSGDITYNFQVYITGVVEDYQVYQKDSLLNEQLWLPTGRYQNGADFEIIAAGNKVFPVHKFILAARSPVFEAQFNNKKTKLSQQIFDDVDATTMEQFLKFIYTGELEGSIKSLKLKELASTYQIKTLEKISEAAAEGMDGDDMVQWVLQLKPEDGKNSIEIRSGANSKEEFSLNSVVLNYMWNWNQWKELDLSTTSAEAFHYKKEKLFRAQVKTGTRSMSREICHELVATLLSCRGQRSGSKIQKVDCSMLMNHKDRNWIWEEMNEKVDASDEGMLQMFTKNATKAKSWQIRNDYSPPFAITFHVKVVII